MPLLANVLITTARSVRNATTGTTAAPTTSLVAIPAHAEPMNAVKYAGFGDAAVSCDYVLVVDSGTDIVENDRISSMVLMSDGTTAWPDDQTAHEFFDVKMHLEQAALLLPARLLFVSRVRGGGPAH